MKIIPILFSTEMVKAILEDRKTQTRRIMKPQPNDNGASYMANAPLDWEQVYKEEWKPWKFETDEGESFSKFCPYGEPGDVLWVRENWKIIGWSFDDGDMLIEYADGVKEWVPFHDPAEDSQWIINKIDLLEKKGIIVCEPDEDDEKSIYKFTDKKHPFYPSIHMPKEVCRLFLKVKNIRVERLHYITEEDAIAEGVEILERHKEFTLYKAYSGPAINGGFTQAKIAFENLWSTIYGEESWNINPWVWVIEFERTEKPHNF